MKIIAAASNNTDNNDVVLPQNESQVKDNPSNLQQISSPEFYSEDNSQSFIKGVAVGFIVGIIIGGVVVFFYKKKLS